MEKERAGERRGKASEMGIRDIGFGLGSRWNAANACPRAMTRHMYVEWTLRCTRTQRRVQRIPHPRIVLLFTPTCASLRTRIFSWPRVKSHASLGRGIIIPTGSARMREIVPAHAIRSECHSIRLLNIDFGKRLLTLLLNICARLQ